MQTTLNEFLLILIDISLFKSADIHKYSSGLYYASSLLFVGSKVNISKLHCLIDRYNGVKIDHTTSTGIQETLNIK